MIFFLMAWQGELTTLPQQPDLYNPAFLFVALLTGLVGFAISFSVLWFLSTTTPTTFSLVVSISEVFLLLSLGGVAAVATARGR